ncbi:MAG TPA: antibiotic biosynthesis monooxygenase family protein [Polyangia bacterium]|nr:antibiotic biosynthesis monooxygenase family protein [Polyangia bacterium]
MFIRLGSFEVAPGRLDELRATYDRDCVPLVKAAPGNLDVYLMEPAEGTGPLVACTVWRTEADAAAYEASGTAKEVVARVKPLFAGPPTLRSYRVPGRG